MTVQPLILAAGLGKRMKSRTTKVLHPLLGRPLLGHVLAAVEEAGLPRPVVVVGNQADSVISAFGDRATFARQSEPKGTGDAVRSALPSLGKKGRVLILYGDTPLLRGDTLAGFVRAAQGARAAILTAAFPDPAGYGRIVRQEGGEFLKIVEEKDANPEERAIREVNTGVYLLDLEDLLPFIAHLGTQNAQGEAYLTDLFGLLAQRGHSVRLIPAPVSEETVGINDRVQLQAATAFMRRRILERWMRDGVTVEDPDTTWVEAGVQLEEDVTLLAGVRLTGDTHIAKGSVIGPDTEISHSRIGEGTRVWRSVVERSTVGKDVQIGPFSHLRPGCEVGDKVEVGNYAELKNTKVGKGTKAHHHSYLGDAVIGENVNIGAGAITVNYDGVKKHVTHIEDDVFVGCNVNLIAPVKIGKGAYVAAGSTVNVEVPAESLAVARERQKNIEGWVRRKRAREE